MSKQTTINQSKLDPVQYLSSLRKDCSQLSTKVAILTFNNTYSHYLDIIILLIEYLQLVSQAMILTPSFNNDDSIAHNIIFQGIVYVSKVMDPELWFDFNDRKTLAKFILVAIGTTIVLKYIVLVYLIIISKFNVKGYSLLLHLWSLTFRFQARITCFFTTSLFFKTIMMTSQENFDVFGLGKTNLLIISIVMITTESVFSLYLQAWYSYILPSSKSFLSSKTNRIESLNLIQKITIKILQSLLIPHLISTYWTFVTINLLFSVVRESHYYFTFPQYNYKALLYQGSLSAVVSSLHIVCLLAIFLEAVGFESKMDFILILWISLSLLMMKISRAYLKKSMINLLNKKDGSPEFLTHRIIFIKYLRKQKRIPSHENETYQLSYLLNVAVDSRIPAVFHLKSTNLQENLFEKPSKETVNKAYLSYLEDLLNKFPKNSFIKLYSAYLYANKLHYYSAAIKIITEIKQTHSGKMKLNADMLIHKIQTRLLTQNQRKSINLSKYIESLVEVAELKAQMLKQADKQTEILQEIINYMPDLEKIFKNGQEIDNFVAKIKTQITHTLGMIPETFGEPLLLCAHYSLILNHSTKDYLSHYKKYSIKNKKYEKYFTSDNLIEENLYQYSNALIMLSGQKADAGKIIFCSKSIEKLYGKSASSYIGTDISSLATPSAQSYYTSYFKALVEKGEESLVGKVTRSFGYHADGHMVQIDFYVDVHPFVTQNFCFNMIVRPVPTNKDYLLVLENGDIECATEKVGKRLGLLASNTSSFSNLINVNSISKELSLINYAFNMIAFPERYKSKANEEFKKKKSNKRRLTVMDVVKKPSTMKTLEDYWSEISNKKAEELYSIYTTKGSSLKFRPINRNAGCEPYSYQCTVSNTFYGSTLIKVVTLDECVDTEEAERKVIGQSQRLNCVEKKSEMFSITINELSENYQYRKKSEGGISENSRPPDENQTGWIDFKTLESPTLPKRIFPSSGNEYVSTIHIASTEEQPFSPLEAKASTFYKTILLDEVNKSPKSRVMIEKASKSSKTPAKKESEMGRTIRIEGSIGGSHWSKSSQHKKITTAVRTALGIKHYSSLLKVLYVSFYFMLVGLFACQIKFKYNMDETLTFIRTSKQIVGSAERRNYLLVTIQQNSRMIWDLGTGKLNRRDRDFYMDTEFYVYLLSIQLEELAVTNQELFRSISNLEEETRDDLFIKDVRIFDSYYGEPDQVSGVFDNFQATSRIIEAGLKGIGIMMKNITESKKEVHFVLRNTVNDLLLKNVMTSDILEASIDLRQEDISLKINIYLVITASLLVLAAMVFVWAIWKQFEREKSNMVAVTKLNANKIKSSLNKINAFKRVLKDERRLDVNANFDILDVTMMKSPRDKYSKEAKRREHAKNAHYAGIRNKYCSYVFNLTVWITAIAGIIIWYSLSHGSSIDFSHEKQDQFFFILRLKSQISNAVTMSQELFAGNGTTLTQNKPTAEELPKIISDLIAMKNKVSTNFMNEDLTLDSQIQDILFNDGCPYVHNESSFFCDLLKLNGKKTSLLYTLSDIINLLQEANANFEDSNRSSESLIAMEAKIYEGLILPYFVAIAECDAISVEITEILENDVASMLDKRDLVFGIFIGSYLTSSILIWILMLKPFREADNKFKKVLQVFPANLILSSFLLKSFLIKTSKVAFNSIKNDM